MDQWFYPRDKGLYPRDKGFDGYQMDISRNEWFAEK
jgi:hypothetical protein